MCQEARHRSGTSKPRQLGGSRLGSRQFVEEGRARPLLFWESRASTLANGAPGHAAVVTFGLKNSSRAASRWFDAQRLKHSGPDGEPIRQELTNIEMFTWLKSVVDGFRNYVADDYAPITSGRVSPEELFLDKAYLLSLAPEWVALVGGLRARGANHDGSKHGLFTDRVGVLSNDFFVNPTSVDLE